MTALPDPLWPILLLALIQFVDGLMSIKPVGFIAACFQAVNWPREYWWMMPLIKFAATAGLVAGIWVPYLAALTCVALVGYFLVAISRHIAARDFGRNLFVNATGMLLICIATGVFCFLT